MDIPFNPFFKSLAQIPAIKDHIIWLQRKQQERATDVFLISMPSVLPGILIELLCAISLQPATYVNITRDTTESDLKQRREMRSSHTLWLDGPVVKAAIAGNCLILDGIERAERNVLPLLNNLLENREIGLDDGRFISRHVQGKSSSSKSFKLTPLNEKFWTCALGIPVPPFTGFPLDPPFRSRFQARWLRGLLHECSPSELVQYIYTQHNNTVWKKEQTEILLLFLEIYKSTSSLFLEEMRRNAGFGASTLFPVDPPLNHHFCSAFPYLVTSISMFPAWLNHCYPLFDHFVQTSSVTGLSSLVQTLVENSSQTNFATPKPSSLPLMESFDGHPLGFNARFSFDSIYGYGYVGVAFNSIPVVTLPCTFHVSERLATALDSMLKAWCLSYSVKNPVVLESDPFFIPHSICLLGPRQSGKTKLLDYFLRDKLGFESTSIEVIPLYKDISVRDTFLARRAFTSDSGGASNSTWNLSRLVRAAIDGKIVVLDGLERLERNSMTPLSRFLRSWELDLPDGQIRLVHPFKYEALVKSGKLDGQQQKVFPVHPKFRLIATGSCGSGDLAGMSWITSDMLSVFHFIKMPDPNISEKADIVASNVSTKIPASLVHFLNFISDDQGDKQNSSGILGDWSMSLCLSSLIRISKQIGSLNDENNMVRMLLSHVVMEPFMSQKDQEYFQEICSKSGLPSKKPFCPPKSSLPPFVKANPSRSLGYELIPAEPLFHDNPEQMFTMTRMYSDMQLGLNVLLIGPQGTGKNKITDKLLYHLQVPRVYMQLHRDSSVASLTMVPSLENGKIVYLESGLVTAVKQGFVLVLDEADKAPLSVTYVLKSLIQDGFLELPDGRIMTRSVPAKSDPSKIITIHPDFRMIVLANVPTFPFQGNDFYRELGHLFSPFCIDSPDFRSELILVRQYVTPGNRGNDELGSIVQSFVAAFQTLRDLVRKGRLSYQYSTRELVQIIRHLDGTVTRAKSKNNASSITRQMIHETVSNVLDFDRMNEDQYQLVREVFARHGIPLLSLDNNDKIDSVIQKQEQMNEFGHINLFDQAIKQISFVRDDCKVIPCEWDVFHVGPLYFGQHWSLSQKSNPIPLMDALVGGKRSVSVSDETSSIPITKVYSQSPRINEVYMTVTMNNIPMKLILCTGTSGKTSFGLSYALNGDVHLFSLFTDKAITSSGDLDASIGFFSNLAEYLVLEKDETLPQSPTTIICCLQRGKGENRPCMFAIHRRSKWRELLIVDYVNDTVRKIDILEKVSSVHETFDARKCLHSSWIRDGDLCLWLDDGTNIQVLWPNLETNISEAMVTISKTRSESFDTIHRVLESNLLLMEAGKMFYLVSTDRKGTGGLKLEAGKGVHDTCRLVKTQKRLGLAVQERLGGCMFDPNNYQIYTGTEQQDEIIDTCLHCKLAPTGKDDQSNLKVFGESFFTVNAVATLFKCRACGGFSLQVFRRPHDHNLGLLHWIKVPRNVNKSLISQGKLETTSKVGTGGKGIYAAAQAIRNRDEQSMKLQVVSEILMQYTVANVELLSKDKTNDIVVTLCGTNESEFSYLWIQVFGPSLMDDLSQSLATQQSMQRSDDQGDDDFQITADDASEANIILLDAIFGKASNGSGGIIRSPGSGGSSRSGTSRFQVIRNAADNPNTKKTGFKVRTEAPKLTGRLLEIHKQVAEANNESIKSWLMKIHSSSTPSSSFTYRNMDQLIAATLPLVQGLQSIWLNMRDSQMERQWLRNQSHGELDLDRKMVESRLGEEKVFVTRGIPVEEMGADANRNRNKLKRFIFVFDLSASMFRFNEHDGRLDRTLQSALLLMLSCLNPSTMTMLRQKLILEIWSHSGDGPLRYWCSFPVANANNREKASYPEFFPSNQMEAVKIIEAMYASCLQCVAGDNSLTALELSLKRVQGPETSISNLDETFIIVTSDALLGQYGIQANDISRIMRSYGNGIMTAATTKPIMIFMGSIGDEAEALKHQLPNDSCYLCLGKSGQELSVIIKNILISRTTTTFRVS